MIEGNGTYDKECKCGSSWEELEWCNLHNEACVLREFCAHNVFSRFECGFYKDKLRCRECGTIVDAS